MKVTFKADYPAVLDACVLLPMPLADTLLRMAETPRLFLPKWSDHILAEVSRNLIEKFGKSNEQAQRREAALRDTFPEALVEGYEPLIEKMTIDPKDRHVLAAALYSGTKLIVTGNRKHFPDEALRAWDVERQDPSTFLIHLYDLAPGIVVRKLMEQAHAVNLTLEDLLLRLRLDAPDFVAFLCEEERIELPS